MLYEVITLQVFLKKLGHDVILAENGEQAVQRFHQSQPDLVLLDIMMPIMDGFEAARRIKAASKEKWVPIIFLSALNRDENLVEGLDRITSYNVCYTKLLRHTGRQGNESFRAPPAEACLALALRLDQDTVYPQFAQS